MSSLRPPVEEQGPRQIAAWALDDARCDLMAAAHNADKAGATDLHRHILASVASVDDALALLAEGA